MIADSRCTMPASSSHLACSIQCSLHRDQQNYVCCENSLFAVPNRFDVIIRRPCRVIMNMHEVADSGVQKWNTVWYRAHWVRVN